MSSEKRVRISSTECPRFPEEGSSSQVRGPKPRPKGVGVVVRPTEVADDGEIVVALIDDEATVKSFYKEKDRVRLEPANKAYKPIRTTDVHLLGRVVGVFRSV